MDTDSASHTLISIEGDYSLHRIRERKLFHELFSRSVDGLFHKVWHVNPLVGADPSEPAASSNGPPTVTELAPGHVVLEGHVALSPWLSWFPPLNLLLAQIVLFVRLSRIVRREPSSILRAGDPYYLGLLALLLSKLHRRPLVIKVAANYDAVFEATGKPAYPRLLRSRKFEKWIERAVYKRADLVAAANQNNLDYVLKNGAIVSRSTIFRYGSWVDASHFAPPGDEADFLEAVGLAGRKVVVFVGRLEPVKHPEDAIRAFAVASRDVPTAALLVIGDGSMRAELESLSRELDIQQSVCFAGARDQTEVRDALRQSHVILAPLAGRGLVEATLSGTPVVAYDIEWHSELLDPASGILVGYRDSEAMGEAARTLLKDEGLAVLLGTSAREKCLEMMDPQKLMAHERSAYAKVLQRG